MKALRGTPGDRGDRALGREVGAGCCSWSVTWSTSQLLSVPALAGCEWEAGPARVPRLFPMSQPPGSATPGTGDSRDMGSHSRDRASRLSFRIPHVLLTWCENLSFIQSVSKLSSQLSSQSFCSPRTKDTSTASGPKIRNNSNWRKQATRMGLHDLELLKAKLSFREKPILSKVPLASSQSSLMVQGEHTHQKSHSRTKKLRDGSLISREWKVHIRLWNWQL